MTEQSHSYDLSPDARSMRAAERERLAVELQDRIAKLNKQAQIFIPLIALCLIAAIPIWSKSLVRFLVLLLSPFVLLPMAFCIIHLAVAWRGIAKTKSRIRDWDRVTHESKELES